MALGVATSVYASRSELTNGMEPQAIICDNCGKGYMVYRTSTDEYSIPRYGRHTSEDGRSCSWNSVHTETVTIISKYDLCNYCGYCVPYSQTKSSTCR